MLAAKYGKKTLPFDKSIKNSQPSCEIVLERQPTVNLMAVAQPFTEQPRQTLRKADVVLIKNFKLCRLGWRLFREHWSTRVQVVNDWNPVTHNEHPTSTYSTPNLITTLHHHIAIIKTVFPLLCRLRLGVFNYNNLHLCFI